MAHIPKFLIFSDIYIYQGSWTEFGLFKVKNTKEKGAVKK